MPNGLSVNRLGFKVGKKLAKAVKRNRIRRILKESYRLSEERLPSGYDFVLAAKEGSLCVDSLEEAMRATDKLFRRAGLFTENNGDV